MNELGNIENYSSRAQFIIPVGSELRIHIDSGTPVSRGAKILVNKPKKLANGEVEYTIT